MSSFALLIARTQLPLELLPKLGLFVRGRLRLLLLHLLRIDRPVECLLLPLDSLQPVNYHLAKQFRLALVAY